uniref:Uncharacterized protein n=1 Tax=Rhizophagus irregularis (strain DAOM 181602 / DAOM 197198 / MUCL 43194) TaxID=747089 RepID=U9UJV6_RHIID
MDLMNAINASIENDDLGNGLWIKKQYDYIDNGDLQECIRRTSYQNIASSGVPMEWQQSRSLSNFLRRDYINNGDKGTKLCAKHKQPEMIDIFYNDYKILFMDYEFYDVNMKL